MYKSILLYTLILLGLFTNSDAGYYCKSPNDCTATCSNVLPEHVELLKNTPWITVPWSDGSCYFHNKETKEDRDSLPFTEIQ